MGNNQFYALMPDNTIKLINLANEIVEDVKNIFIEGAKQFKLDNLILTKFTGDYMAMDGEDVLYVDFKLPDKFKNVPKNQADISDFKIGEEVPKSIFYYDDGKYYFQVFNKKNILQRKMILCVVETGDKFAKIKDSAFIIEEKVHAIYEKDKLYFQNYTLANQIFSLKEFLVKATNKDIDTFVKKGEVSVDGNRLKNIANTKTRRLIKQLDNSDNLRKFIGLNQTSRSSILKKCGVDIAINNNQIELPTKSVAELNRVLEFLNEDIFIGQITKERYLTNSKKKDV